MIKYITLVCRYDKILIDVAAYVIPHTHTPTHTHTHTHTHTTETCRSNFDIKCTLLISAYVAIIIININFKRLGNF